MKRTSVAVFLFLFCVAGALGQAPSTGEVAQPAPAPGEAVKTSLEVKADLEKAAKKRAEEKKAWEIKLKECGERISVEQARLAEKEAEPAKLQKDIDVAKESMEQAYKELDQVSSEYQAAEDAERSEYQTLKITELQARYDKEFSDQKARHEQDMDFIAKNKWVTSDMKQFTVAVEGMDGPPTLTFAGGSAGSVSGTFPTADFESGIKRIHQVPPGATYSAVIQIHNPFVVDVSIHPGSDFLACGSTNVLDWDIHIFIAKDFRKKAGEKGQFRIVGISWPVDLGRPQCWQVCEPPVFEPTPMPEQQVADAKTPEIVGIMKQWAPVRLDGLKKKKVDADSVCKSRRGLHETLLRRLPTQLDRIQRRVADIKDKIDTEAKKKKEIEEILLEYKEEIPAAAPAAAGAAAPAEEI